MKTVLIIDDEFGISEALTSLLEDERYRVFTAANGEHGYERILELSPDIIIADYMMPVMNGAELVKKLKSEPQWSSLPIIMMSGVSEAIVRRECDEYDVFLRKPFHVKSMLDAIRDPLKP